MVVRLPERTCFFCSKEQSDFGLLGTDVVLYDDGVLLTKLEMLPQAPATPEPCLLCQHPPMLSSSWMDAQPSQEHVLLFCHVSPVNEYSSLCLECFLPLSSTQQTPHQLSKPSSDVNSYGKLCAPPHPAFSSVRNLDELPRSLFLSVW